MIDAFVEIFRHSLRQLGRHPGFAAAVVLTLALGVGATSAIFSVVNGVMLKPLPYPQADQVVRLGWQWGPDGGLSALSGSKFEHAREHTDALAALAVGQGMAASLKTDGQDGMQVRGQRVSSDWLRVLGYTPALGRDFDPGEDRPGGDRMVVISDRVWHEVFAADPDALGRSVRLDEQAYRIIAVLGPEFRFVDSPGWTDFLVPLQLQADPRDAGHNYRAIGRLRDTVGLDQARAEIQTLGASLAQRHPELEQRGDLQGRYLLADYRSVLVGSRLSRNLWLLLGAVGFVLLIVTSNVASLFLTRMARRRAEIAVRSALGAGRGRMHWQILAESAMLGLVGGVLGLVLAVWLVEVLLQLSPPLPRADAIGLDWRVLGFTLVIALLSALGSALAAAWKGARIPPAACLRDGGYSGSGSRRAAPLRGALLGVQSALAVVLLTGALMMISSLYQLRNLELGFAPDQVVVVDFGQAAEQQGGPAARRAFQQDLLATARALPGARSAAVGATLPFQQGLNIPVTLADDPTAGEGAVEWRAVDGDYFETLGIAVNSGRVPDPADRAGAAPVVVVSQSFARHYFGSENPVGRHLMLGYMGQDPIMPGWEAEEPAREIIGVVADVRDIHPGESPRRTVYVPMDQVPPTLTEMLSGPGGLLVRADGRPEQLFGVLRQAIERIDPGLPDLQIQRLSELGGGRLDSERFNAVLLSCFAGLAMILVAVGLYGVLSFLVAQRTREIGVHLALGAAPARVMIRFMRQGLAWIALGGGSGLLMAFLLADVFEGLVFDLAGLDSAAIAAAAALLAVVSLLAAWLPARRAARTPAAEALRHD